MKKTAVIFGILMIATVFSFQNATAEPFEQETYLFMKQDVGAGVPWPIIEPTLVEEDINTSDYPYGKLEYSTFGPAFCFDFKGYFPFEEIDGEIESDYTEDYALIYYVDADVGWPGGPPPLYVFGIGTPQYYDVRGKSKQFPFYGVKIEGCDSDIGQLPSGDDPLDPNYPLGAKIWLVPARLINVGLLVDGKGWSEWIDWDAEAILFETSLITFGFVYTPPPVD